LVGVGRGAGFFADGGRGFGLGVGGFGRGLGRVVVAVRVGVAVVVGPPAGDGGPGDDSRVADAGDRSAAVELEQAPITHTTTAINTAIPHRNRTPRIAGRVIAGREMCSSHFPFSRRGG
jgi:hypothetical protein